ncbi:putative golgin subfamily A member 6-like protein 19 [Prorops nasuta]|uniref:putative golgin subfamily A member 6-like protein 19 n=1 Tax=Prorops nasuta TaxID=863751 RepID=UPI0034CD0E33
MVISVLVVGRLKRQLNDSKMKLESSAREFEKEVDTCHEKEEELQQLLTSLRKENDYIKANSQREVECSQQKIAELQVEVAKLREKETTSGEVETNLTQKIEAFVKEIEELREREDRANQANAELNRKLEVRGAEIGELQIKLEIVEDEARRLREKEIRLLEFEKKEAEQGDRCLGSVKDVKVRVIGGDPVVDMTRQLNSNREMIEKLTRQNERLSKTLNRLQDYRIPSRTR